MKIQNKIKNKKTFFDGGGTTNKIYVPKSIGKV